ncbi:viral cathepsin [Phtheirospermum japonicum]|uniref:Viral cathepsin n=1 Tax=Phtheirospermum japonicum TaxID=374723 RepID=A0A830DAP0_9LAMI|nr:viral cathepsin [Phtheirospermum japonicum]
MAAQISHSLLAVVVRQLLLVSNWYLYSRASTLSSPTMIKTVVVANGTSILISHVGSCHIHDHSGVICFGARQSGFGCSFGCDSESSDKGATGSGQIYLHINRLPTPLLGNKSPLEILFQASLKYAKFKTFCCRPSSVLRGPACGLCPSSDSELPVAPLPLEVEPPTVLFIKSSSPPLTNTTIVGSKWVFRIEFLSDGFVEHYKARLVAECSFLPCCCVHHATTVCVEARYRLKLLSGEDPPQDIPWLSVQDTIDGARTGTIHYVLRWMTNTGVTTEAAYPFVGPRQGFHVYNKYPFLHIMYSLVHACDHFTMKDYIMYEPSKNTSANDDLKSHLRSDGPFMILMKYTNKIFKHFDHANQVFEGIKNVEDGDKINSHLVAVIGEGCKGGVHYWQYLNNWGTGWGRDGKGMIAKNAVECAYVPIIY